MFVFVKIWLEGGKVSASLFQYCFSATAHWSSLCGWFMFPLREYDCCNSPHYQAPPLGAMWDGWSEDSYWTCTHFRSKNRSWNFGRLSLMNLKPWPEYMPMIPISPTGSDGL